MRDADALFLAAYRDAAEQLQKGDLSVHFPEGSFPPALPFVRAELAPSWRLAAT